MQFPGTAFLHALIARLNADEAFATASRWSDVKVVLAFGDERWWLKLYGGKVIDSMPWFPMANPLGWDYQITAPLATWQALPLEPVYPLVFFDAPRVKIRDQGWSATRPRTSPSACGRTGARKSRAFGWSRTRAPSSGCGW